jgi:hypothetical protein
MMGKRQKIYLGAPAAQNEAVTWHRPVIGLLFGIAIMMLVALLSGCASRCETSCLVLGNYEPTVSPKMIFRSQNDPPVDPQVFAYRSDWPAAVGDIEFGRVTSYRQLWYDRQSASSNIPDNSYKQTRSYRYGTSVR